VINETKSISVIIPVYNAEDTLERCLDSILQQTVPGLEIILVDDGSPDGSGTICDAYAARHACIHATHQANQGVSAARNAGLALASGNYVTFIDPDDYVQPGYFDGLGNGNNADLIFIGQLITNERKNGQETESVEELKQGGGDFSTFLAQNLQTLLLRGAVGKFFARHIIEGITFDRLLKTAEDTLFNLLCYQKVKTYAVSTLSTYMYFKPTATQQAKKYNMSTEQGLYTLSQVMKAYNRLRIRCKKFERLLYRYLMKLTKQERTNCHNPAKWFRNKTAFRIFWKYQSAFDIKFCIKYGLSALLNKDFIYRDI